MATIKPWPPASGLTTKVVPRKKATVQVARAITIKAPAALVFDTLLHVSEYSTWNTWIPSVTIHAQPIPSDSDKDGNTSSHLRIGTIFTFNVVSDPDKPNNVWRSHLRVTDIHTPSSPTSYLSPELLSDPTFTSNLSKVYRVSWDGQGNINERAMQLERFHEVIETGEEECEVRTWENFGGLLAWAIKLVQEKTLNEKVGIWCTDLKKHCEAKHLQYKGDSIYNA